MNILSIYSFFSILFLPKDFSLFDDILPLWFFWELPIFWPFVIPIVTVFYSIALYLIMLYLKIDNPLKKFRKTIIKVTFFGFLCDIIVVVMLLLVAWGGIIFISPTSNFYHWYKNIFLDSLGKNIFGNIFAFLVLSFTILLSRVLNYKLNKKFTFSKLDIEEENKKKLALAIAIFTAPYIFFFSFKNTFI